MSMLNPRATWGRNDGRVSAAPSRYAGGRNDAPRPNAMNVVDNQRRRTLVAESRQELRIELKREPNAREVLRRVDQKDPGFQRKWSGRQEYLDRMRTTRQLLRELQGIRSKAPSSDRPNARPALQEPLMEESSIRADRSVRRSPLWIVGAKQRNDLAAAYSPIDPGYRGDHVPSLLSRGRLPIRDIECRIGPKLRLYANDIIPGERGQFTHPSGQAYVYLFDLFGGLLAVSEASRWPRESGYPELHLEFEVRYRYGDGRQRGLQGDLVGDTRRGFNRFEPKGGEPTPLYG